MAPSPAHHLQARGRAWLALLALLALCLLPVLAPADPLPGAPPLPQDLEARVAAALAAKGADYVPRTEHRLPDGRPRYTNRLILEDSPYLLQHAHNPVNWYPWGEAAFEAARRTGRPIFLSIGYSTCHWCHVMERESFENPEIARFLNEHFIPVKVDRERRPDVDEIYMTAVMLTTGHGGWPLSTFLTPEGRPFFGGTYFPAEEFLKVLQGVDELWRDRPGYVKAQAAKLAQAVVRYNTHRRQAGTLSEGVFAETAEAILTGYDEVQGGFGTAPKFPHESELLFLEQYYWRTRDARTLHALDTTLDAMAHGGIYDQVGGGFHRYSTTPDWLVPHFEKMLYNQALLARVYTGMYALSRAPRRARVAVQTLDYVLRDMQAPGGAFYSATDADSEGQEGAFFLWTPAQLRAALPKDDARLAIEFFGATDRGNFEGRNILHVPVPPEAFVRSHGMSLEALLARVERIRERLYEVREHRTHPGRDGKIVTAWNGMMVTALAEAGRLLGKARYTEAAARAADFLWGQARRPDGGLWRVHLDGRSSVAGKLDDYAAYAQGLIALYDTTADIRWLDRARTMADQMIERFEDPDQGGLFMTEQGDQKGLFVRPKRFADGALPSGNAMALRVLAGLYARSGEPVYEDRANALVAAATAGLGRYPQSHSYLLIGLDELRHGLAGPLEYAARGRVRSELREPSIGPRGDRVSVVVEARMRPGWHINAHRITDPDLVPTVIGLGQTPHWRVDGVDYPSPVTRRLGFSRSPLTLYEGRARFTVRLERIDATATETPPILPLRLRVQACSDKVCLAPEAAVLELALPEGRP